MGVLLRDLESFKAFQSIQLPVTVHIILLPLRTDEPHGERCSFIGSRLFQDSSTRSRDCRVMTVTPAVGAQMLPVNLSVVQKDKCRI